MYCSSCGTNIVRGLAYCNHCGEKLVTSQTQIAKTSEVPPESLVWAIVAIFVVGMGTIIGLMAVMKNALNFDIGPIMFFTMVSFALMVIIEAVFIWLLLSRRRQSKALMEMSSNAQPTKELSEGAQRVLPEPMHSVTDQTTRAFDPIYERRK